MKDWADLIDEHGWAVVKVPELGLAYSIGLLERFGHPEVAILGLPVQTAHMIINIIGGLVRGGESFGDGDETASGVLLEGYACAFRAVHPSRFEDYLGQLLDHYPPGDIPVLQCCWPDATGAFPWSEHASDWLIEHQERLYLGESAEGGSR